MAQRKTKSKQKNKKNRVVHRLLLIIGLLLIVLLGGYVWYIFHTIPSITAQKEMTVMPKEFQRVLGEKTGPSTTPLRVPIFLYHYVEPPQTEDPGRQNLNIPPYILTSQIETLKKAGYTFTTPSEFTTVLLGKKKLPAHMVILSFDDGYQDFYDYVYPVLQKEKVKAVIYIVPDFLDHSNYLSTNELKILAKSPLIEVGAHSMDHLWLAGRDSTTVSYQISQSRKVLQNLLQLPITSFAYPYGAFDTQAVDDVISAGFTNAVSTVPGILESKNNNYFYFRLRPGYRTGEGLLSFLKQDTFQPW